MCAERERDTQGRVGSNVFSSSSPWEKKICQWFSSRHGEKKRGGGGFHPQRVYLEKRHCAITTKRGVPNIELYIGSLCFFIFLFNELEALPTNYWGLFLAAQRGETQGG
jgi:hypothetical protein